MLFFVVCQSSVCYGTLTVVVTNIMITNIKQSKEIRLKMEDYYDEIVFDSFLFYFYKSIQYFPKKRKNNNITIYPVQMLKEKVDPSCR
jgi:hypothetical protein